MGKQGIYTDVARLCASLATTTEVNVSASLSSLPNDFRDLLKKRVKLGTVGVLDDRHTGPCLERLEGRANIDRPFLRPSLRIAYCVLNRFGKCRQGPITTNDLIVGSGDPNPHGVKEGSEEPLQVLCLGLTYQVCATLALGIGRLGFSRRKDVVVEPFLIPYRIGSLFHHGASIVNNPVQRGSRSLERLAPQTAPVPSG